MAPRAVVRIRLVGGQAGRIPLSDLGELASGVQETVLRIARGLADRTGPGRTPDDLRRWVMLDATGIEAGSAVLVIEAPGLEDQQLPIEDIEDDPGVRALVVLADVLDALGSGQPMPSELDQLSEQSVRRLVGRLVGYDRVEWSHQQDGNVRTVTLHPGAIDTEPTPPSPGQGTYESLIGRLYQVNLRSHGYGIEDDLGRTLHCDFPSDLRHLEEIRSLVGRQVMVTGMAFRDEEGKIERFQVERIDAAGRDGETGDFFDFNLSSALAATPPIHDVSLLRIEELTEAETAAFWQALNE